MLFDLVGFLARSVLAHSHKANDKDRLQRARISQDKSFFLQIERFLFFDNVCDKER